MSEEKKVKVEKEQTIEEGIEKGHGAGMKLVNEPMDVDKILDRINEAVDN